MKLQAHNKKESDQYTSDCEKVGYVLWRNTPHFVSYG